MKQKLILILILTLLLPAVGFAVPEFHINPQTDELAQEQASGYEGKAISSVTQALGSPSMVRDDLSNPAMIDYIYIGNSLVYIFSVNREGKDIAQVAQYSRGNWDGGLYANYAG